MTQNLDNRDKSVLCTEAGNVTLTLLLFRCLIQVLYAPLKPHGGIITFKQGVRELRITPASVKYCLTLSHYSKAPHHSLLSLAFIASGTFSRSAAFHFTHTHVHLHTHTHTVRADATSWQSPLCGVCVVLCISLVKQRLATTIRKLNTHCSKYAFCYSNFICSLISL